MNFCQRIESKVNRNGILARSLWCGAICAIAAGLWIASSAQAADPAAAAPAAAPTVTLPVPPDLRPLKDSAAMGANEIATIKDYVTKATAILVNDNATAAQLTTVRRWLDEGSRGVGGNATPQYLDAYCKQLNETLVAQLKKVKSIRGRLNMAIVVFRVVSSTPDASLLPAIIDLLNDQSDVVALWAMKAAGKMLAVPVPAKNLLDRIVPSVQAHACNGPLTDEAYKALQQANPDTIKAMLSLYALRANEYQKGTPDDPVADRWPGFYLTQAAVWPTLSADDQQRVMQLTAALLVGTGAALKHAETLSERNESLVSLLKQTGGVLNAVATNTDKPNLNTCGTALSRLSVGSTKDQIAAEIQNALAEIVKAFPKVKVPAATP